MIIQSKYICNLFKASHAITIFIFIFVRHKNDKQTINHEKIHIVQQIELLFVGQWIWYLIEYIRKGYKNNMFEKEAWSNESNLSYLEKRKPYAFLNYKS